MSTFICRSDDPIHDGLDCYKGTYFIHFIAALIGTIILLFMSFLSTILCIDLNPWSLAPFAAPRSRLNVLKLLAKIAVPIFFIVDYQVRFF